MKTAAFLRENDGSSVWAEDDRAWFAERPHRRHRIRPHVEGEWAVARLEPELPRGWRWWTVIRVAAPGLRLRLPLPLEGEPATGEHAAARWFEIVRARGGIFAPAPKGGEREPCLS